MVGVWEDLQARHANTPDSVADQELVSLAIRILSAIANSTACERNFSCFGITHTAQRNSLAVESTHDINFVRMDINARHADAGLKPCRLKRKHAGDDKPELTSSSTVSSATSGQSENSDPLDTDALDGAAHELVASEGDRDPTDFDAMIAATLQANVPEPDPEEFASGSYRKIRLCDLFIYTDVPSDSPLLTFWNGAVQLLHADEAVHEAAQNAGSTS